jgi:hypothetical protein
MRRRMVVHRRHRRRRKKVRIQRDKKNKVTHNRDVV